jgi:hypothetical protein
MAVLHPLPVLEDTDPAMDANMNDEPYCEVPHAMSYFTP